MIFLFFNGGQATCGIDLVPVVAGSNITLTPVAAGSLTLLFRLANSATCAVAYLAAPSAVQTTRMLLGVGV